MVLPLRMRGLFHLAALKGYGQFNNRDNLARFGTFLCSHGSNSGGSGHTNYVFPGHVKVMQYLINLSISYIVFAGAFVLTGGIVLAGLNFGIVMVNSLFDKKIPMIVGLSNSELADNKQYMMILSQSINNMMISIEMDKKNDFDVDTRKYNQSYADISKTHSPLSRIKTSGRQSDTRTKSHANAKLDAHGVSAALQQEIIRMAASKVPRETVIDHIQRQLAGISLADATDIVVAAHIVNKRSQPKSMDMKAAQKLIMSFLCKLMKRVLLWSV